MMPSALPAMTPAHPSDEPPTSCRLCAHGATFRFARTDVDGRRVRYYNCSACKSLQTETPDWLDRVYPSPRAPGQELPDLDTGAVERTTYCRTAVYFLCKFGKAIHRHDKVIDVGGGPGLLARMLRDAGIDAYSHDKYVANHFAAGFGFSPECDYALVTSFEVFEHYAHPAQEIHELFTRRPVHLLISTERYRSQGPDWPYLGPPQSQHVFFYSSEALLMIGAKFGYRVEFLPRNMVLFSSRPIAPLRLATVKALLTSRQVAEMVFLLLWKRSLVGSDGKLLRQQLANASSRQQDDAAR